MQGYNPNAQRAKKKPQGARIVGPGTGTSDSIQKEVADGSYIMPADSTEAIGDQALERMGGKVPVNVSNGEFEMPPEQVHAVGVQALDQMKDATHTPVPKQPQGMGYEPEMFFANGGQVLPEEMYGQDAIRQNMQLRMDRNNENPDIDYVIPDKPNMLQSGAKAVGDYTARIGPAWSESNAQFEATNPSFGQRMDRSLNPLTSFGSSLGAMHDAAGAGDKSDMALAAAQAIPTFAALKTVKALPIKNTFGNPFNQAATRTVFDASRSAGVVGASSVGGASIDEYQAARDGDDNNFADGGAVDKDKLKRDPAQVIFETTEPNPNSLSNPSEQGGARQASNLVDRNADKALAAQQGMQGVADRATAGLNIPPSPLPGVGGYDPANPSSPKPAAPVQADQSQPTSGGFFRGAGDYLTGAVKTNAGILAAPLGYAADGLRVGAANAFGGDANTLPGGRDKYSSMAGDLLGSGVDDLKRVGNSVQAGGRDLLGVQAAPQQLATAQPTVASQQTAPAVPSNPEPQVDPQQAAAAQAKTAADQVQTQVDPAQQAGMANNITRVGNSFSAQGPINQGYTVNGQAQGQTNVAQAPQSAQNQQAVANLFDRTPEFGSGSGVSGYQPQKQGMGTRVTVVRDPTRMPSNAEIMNQKMESAQLRNADAARKTDIEGRRADLGILDQQAQNAMRQQQLGIYERNQLLGERKFEIDQQSQGYNLRSAQRLEQAYEALQNAETPEDKMVALENLSAVRGDRESNQNLSNNFMKIKVPAMDAEGRVIGEREEPVDLRKQGQSQQMPPIGENPAAMQIKNNTKLSREEKQQQLRALGYQ